MLPRLPGVRFLETGSHCVRHTGRPRRGTPHTKPNTWSCTRGVGGGGHPAKKRLTSMSPRPGVRSRALEWLSMGEEGRKRKEQGWGWGWLGEHPRGHPGHRHTSR